MTGKTDLTDALANTRRAYRLLYGFHRRVFAIATEIDCVLAPIHIRFHRSEPGHEYLDDDWTPGDATDYWEALPFFSTIFHWARGADDRIEMTDRYFGVQIDVDDSWSRDDVEDDADPDTIATPAEASRTMLMLFYARPLKTASNRSVRKAWDVEVDQILTPVVSRNGLFRVVRKDVDMAALHSKADVHAMTRSFLEEAEQLLA